VICPNCRAEYRPGFTRCSDCDVPLVESLPEPDPEPAPASHPQVDLSREPLELVSVFRSVDPGRIALAKSVLRSADVPFLMHNELALSAGGVSPFFMPAGPMLLGPIRILVRRDDADDARLLVRDLEGTSIGVAADDIESEDEGHS
jgi:hypothetical protein